MIIKLEPPKEVWVFKFTMCLLVWTFNFCHIFLIGKNSIFIILIVAWLLRLCSCILVTSFCNMNTLFWHVPFQKKLHPLLSREMVSGLLISYYLSLSSFSTIRLRFMVIRIYFLVLNFG